MEDLSLRREASRIPSVERERILHEFNDTSAYYPDNQLIHEVFEELAKSTPDAVAAVCGDRQLTYGQLNRTSNEVAHTLLQRGVRPLAHVALYAERSIDTVICLLGILKAGCAYVPLDPSYPTDRLKFMLDDSSPSAVLAKAGFNDRMSELKMPVIAFDGDFAQRDEAPKISGLNSRNVAYVVYTSGSTGQPKGVMIEHRSVLRLVMNASYAHIGPEDCVAHCASPSFDAITWEVWAALLNGARLLVVPQSIVLNPSEFNQVLVRQAATALWLTVGLFNEYVDTLEQAFAGLRYLLTGGDALNPRTVFRALTKAAPAPRHLINAYGPTETTTFATTFSISALNHNARLVPIGRPIGNTRVYILNDNRELVPIGAMGEIYIGGPGVARGYLNRPELTAEHFLPDPFCEDLDARLYRTGDLGSWNSDGNIEFLGRNDSQVKIRGFRIEPAEVEIALQSYPGVKQAMVVTRDEGPGEKRLAAYVVMDVDLLKATSESFKEGSAQVVQRYLVRMLRQHLNEKLPPFMVPSAFAVLDGFPVNVNGKVDRRALPVPERYVCSDVQYEAPLGRIEETLEQIWRQVLGLDHVGRDDNFFELGGDSLLGLKLMRKISDDVGIQPDSVSFFKFPTIRKMAGLLEEILPHNLKPVETLDQSDLDEGLI